MTESVEKATQTDEEPQLSQEKDDESKILKVLARYFPETSMVYKSVKEKLDTAEARDALVEKKGIPSRKSRCGKGFDEPKTKPKPDHNFVINQRAEIQYLVDFHSSRVEFSEFPCDPFSKHLDVFSIFRLIVLDKEPVTKLVLCSRCRKLLVRYRPSGTNLIRHFQRHMKDEEEKHQAQKNLSKWRVDEFRKRSGQNFHKVRATKDKSESAGRIVTEEKHSVGNVQSISSRSLRLSGLHPQEETENRDPETRSSSLSASFDEQNASHGEVAEGIIMSVDDPILISLGLLNTQSQSSAAIANKTAVEPAVNQRDGSENPGLLKLERDW